ncbi:serine hydrolase [Brachybacterium sp. MASK1Z-5]|uniref:Serine hydrolase n=1 Tax=Brachybacterium halotolerans TaxID=2795215 RepID=A0ABS1BCB9_9MICO|nr:serine hydrolase [Brachybacterium halotolerans]MBK0331645.1 serine hydrolase [Brachybacterium halotolerans]
MTLPTASAPSDTAIAWCLLDVQGRELSSSEADRPFYAASTIKLHVLLAALRAADRGELDPDAAVPATRTFTGEGGTPFTLAGDHLDPTHPDDGQQISVRDLLVRMIDRSSNEATDHVLSLVGLEAVASVIADLELPATRVERMIGDDAALASGRTNETSARDLTRTLDTIVRGGGALEPGSRDLAREALAAQRIRIIGRAVRPGVPVLSKSGWVDGFRHDVAAVGDGGADDDRPLVLAVMTCGWDEAEADERILALTRELLPADLLR